MFIDPWSLSTGTLMTTSASWNSSWTLAAASARPGTFTSW